MKIVVDDKIPYIRETLAKLADEVVYLKGSEIGPEDVRDADALIVRTRTLCNEQLLKGSKVQFVATATIGYDHLDTTWLEQNGITWTNCPGCNSGSVAQYIESVLASLNPSKRRDLPTETELPNTPSLRRGTGGGPTGGGPTGGGPTGGGPILTGMKTENMFSRAFPSKPSSMNTGSRMAVALQWESVIRVCSRWLHDCGIFAKTSPRTFYGSLMVVDFHSLNSKTLLLRLVVQRWHPSSPQECGQYLRLWFPRKPKGLWILRQRLKSTIKATGIGLDRCLLTVS
jgi:hypothetical protein